MIKIENTLKTSVTYNGTGTQTRFDFPFDYLRKSFVHVSVDNTPLNTYQYTIDGRTVVFNTAPASGSVIRIYRETATDRLVVWADASVLKAADMTIQQVQQLHILEEANDWTKSSSIILNDEGTAWQGRNYRLTNISDPVDEQDAVTKRYIDNEENSFMATMNALKNQTEQMANQSSTNANNAKKSEANAKTSETNAKNSEIAAKDSETNAKLSETNAKNGELDARASANDAEASRESARSAATAASNYADASRSSANEAQTYMNNAKNYSENVNVFIPSVSAAGVLSWTNRAGLDNPASVNIKGDKGDKGDTGTAATIEVGTVTTGAAGSSASVTNSGTASNVVLNFTLPKGADGKGAVITVNGKEPDASGNVNVKEYTHPASGVTAGTYRSVTVNAQGHVTAGSNPTLAIVNGGTGATTAKQARVNLGLDSTTGLVPTGSVVAFAGSSIPNGYLLCDGSAVSRTTYSALYSAIGTKYGTGNGSTTFNLPNLTNKFIQGSNTAGTVKSAGLPDITGWWAIRRTNISDASNDSVFCDGSTFYKEGSMGSEYTRLMDDDFKTSLHKIIFKASNSNAIYGNSTTVQPPALTMRYIIKY